MFKQSSFAIDFLRQLNDKRVVVVYDDDPDGICSAVLMINYLKKQENKIFFFAARSPSRVTRELMNQILKLKPYAVISLDFAENLDFPANKFDLKGIKYLAIDHHPPKKYNFPLKTVYVNPKLEDNKECCSAFVYSLISRIIPFEKNLWIAAIGVIGDYQVQESRALIEKVIKMYPPLFENITVDNKSLRKTTFGSLARSLDSISSVKFHEGCNQAVNLLLKSRTPYDALNRKIPEVKRLFNIHDGYHSNLRKLEAEFKDNHEKIGKIYYFKVKSEYSVKSTLSTELGAKYPSKVVIIAQDDGKLTHASLRNQSGKYDLNEIIQKSIKGLHGRGGGHKKAAGVALQRTDFGIFLKRFARIVNRQR